MSITKDRTPWRWVALGLLAAALLIMVFPTLPYRYLAQDAGSNDILVNTNHLRWFDPVAWGGGANFAAPLTLIALLIAAALTVVAALRAPSGKGGPDRSPTVATVATAALAVIALLFGGGASVWGWVAVALLAAATAANFLPTRPAGRPLLPTPPSR